MGDTFNDGEPWEKPVHKACVDRFSIGKYEVTQKEWMLLMDENPSYFKKGDNYPVENISWKDAHTFIDKLNKKTGKKFRLPTEAEWEYAARSGGLKESFSGGNTADSVAWFDKNSGGSTHPVGKKAANKLGIYDMSGNVWEWCLDKWGERYYSKSIRKNPKGPLTGSEYVVRGGCWGYEYWFVRTANRYKNSIDYHDYQIGFRLVLPWE